MAKTSYERILDKTARIPGQVYSCAFHYGFNAGNEAGKSSHYPLDEGTLCPRCFFWEELCDQWYESVSVAQVAAASLRCMRKKGHVEGHLCEDLNGQRFSWMPDGTVDQEGPFTDEFNRADGNAGATWASNTKFDMGLIRNTSLTTTTTSYAAYITTVI